jgi:hypothetical protein
MSPGEAAALVVIPALLTNIWQGWFGLAPTADPAALADAAGGFVGTFVATALGWACSPEAAALARKALGIMIFTDFSASPEFNCWCRLEPSLARPTMGAANGAVSTATGVSCFRSFLHPVARPERDDLVRRRAFRSRCRHWR